MLPLPTAIQAQHLSHTYPGKPPVVANDDVSFSVRQGEIFGLLGPNGAGKTTLISTLLGLVRPTSGDICIEGVDVIKEPDKVKELIGFLPQTGMPMRYIEVERALFFTGRLRGQSAPDAKQQSAALIDELGLGDYRRKYVNKLSGGYLRLTNFAMALMGRPRILFLDEPTNELDPHRRRIVWDMIAHLNDQEGLTCVLVTHNVLEAERVIQQVAVMRKGRIIASGTPGELKLSANQNSRVKLEFRLKEGETLPENLPPIWANVQTVRAGQYSLTIALDEMEAATALVVRHFGPERLDDFRIAPPSLEDIYLDLKDQNGNDYES
ncbi:MAG: ABC transporter ATP-binding protein [Burkholderiales bacterium]|nr:ABC transporter ATP-binding protein [Anaerolineae bacterium]